MWPLWETVLQRRSLRMSDSELSTLLANMTAARVRLRGARSIAARAGLTSVLLTQPGRAGPSQQAVFRPAAFARFAFSPTLGCAPRETADRHDGEIASFHLDRLLGFHRAPPVVGWRLAGGRVAGSLTLWLSGRALREESHPWRDSARVAERPFRRRSADRAAPCFWFENASLAREAGFCRAMLAPLRRADGSDAVDPLELLDMVIFDFLIGNADRHTLHVDARTGSLVALDNAKSFGDARDGAAERSARLLAPLAQCCHLARPRTIARLRSPRLGRALQEALASDPLAPILHTSHAAALDAKARAVLAVADGCQGGGAGAGVPIGQEQDVSRL